MSTISLNYILLKKDDNDIPLLKEIHRLPQISKFIHIDEDRYFEYVTVSDHVVYYKILLNGKIIATLHCECEGDTLYLSLFVVPAYQKRGIGSQILVDIKAKKIDLSFSKIQVCIEKDNTASIRLFEKSGFTLLGEEDELLTYIL